MRASLPNFSYILNAVDESVYNVADYMTLSTFTGVNLAVAQYSPVNDAIILLTTYYACRFTPLGEDNNFSCRLAPESDETEICLILHATCSFAPIALWASRLTCAMHKALSEEQAQLGDPCGETLVTSAASLECAKPP